MALASFGEYSIAAFRNTAEYPTGAAATHHSCVAPSRDPLADISASAPSDILHLRHRIHLVRRRQATRMLCSRHDEIQPPPKRCPTFDYDEPPFPQEDPLELVQDSTRPPKILVVISHLTPTAFLDFYDRVPIAPLSAGATGRNGGHLTPTAFLDFYGRVTKYGTEEVKRSP
ncbi:hypothetical protein V8E55_001347 [Tylopilus felleus]